jgi:vWA-MoxR associated protein C-terminal domain/Effector-associated domain 1
MKLSGSEFKELRIALTSAYPSKDKLKRLIRESDLSINIEEIAFGENLNDIVYKLLEWSESHNNLEILLKAAYEENPNNRELKAFVEKTQTIFGCANISTSTSNFPESYWKELCLILTEIDIDIIAEACRDTLENISKNRDILGAYPELTKLDIPSLKKILLQKCPYNDKQAPTIVEFAERLASFVEQPLKNKLNSWVKTVATELNIDLPTYPKSNILSDFSDILKSTLKSYLMIIATPIGENKVSLEAELIFDYQSKDNRTVPEKIDLAEIQTNIICTFAEIADNVYAFIRESRKKLKIKKKFDLTIEVFLPIEYLNKNIEFQPINYNNNISTIGYDNRLIVRCLERFTTDDEEYLTKLYERWDLLDKLLISNRNKQDIKNRFASLSIDNCNWLELENSWLDEERFGVKVECLPDSNIEDIKFFQTLVKAGVPISLWAKCDNLIDIDTFDTLLTTENLRNINLLCESVWKFRRKAYAKPDRANYLGYHLGFLCDNPYRLPFRLMPENQDFIETGY